MMLDKEMSIIESILFMETEPVTAERILKISGLSKNILPDVMEALKEHYQDEKHGIELLELNNGYILTPKPNLQEQLKEHYSKKHEAKLSRAALETLAIIAYSQPLTKAEIENIRGVSAEGMLRLLIKLNFIKEVGKKDAPGKPVLYGTTKDFLSYFQLKSIADLPKLNELETERFELNG